MSNELAALFDARSVAVVGASNNPHKPSHWVIKTMLEQGYTGRLYPVNPAESAVLGLTCFPSVLDIPDRLDLLVISVSAEHVLPIVAQAARRGDVRGAVILSAGLAETAIPERVQLERDIVATARGAGMRIVGPNCIGIANTDTRLYTGFAPGVVLKPGHIGFVSQSGAFGGSFLMLCADQPDPLGFSRFGQVGNMSDVTNLEILDHLAQDPQTTTIGMYMEGVRDGREFLTIAGQVTRQKPVFVLKTGRTDIGSRATLSHTGTLAGSDRIYDAAFRQAGVVRVETIEELLDACKASAMLPRPKGRHLCILTEAGGPGIIAMDEVGRDGSLELASLGERTRQRLEALLPQMAVVCKPMGYVDMTASAMADEHGEALRLVLDDPNVDMVLLISVPPTFLPAIDVAERVADAARGSTKPVAVCLMRGSVMNAARKYLEERSVPTYDTPDRAARALVNLSKATGRIRGGQG